MSDSEPKRYSFEEWWTIYHARVEEGVDSRLSTEEIRDIARCGFLGGLELGRMSLLDANLALIHRSRTSESEAEQIRVDLALARNECARLREVIERFSEIAERPMTDHVLAVDLRRLVKLKFPREVGAAQ